MPAVGYLRRIWGLPETAGGVLLGLATASPDAVTDGIVSLTLAMLPLCILNKCGQRAALSFEPVVLVVNAATSNRFRGQHLEFGRVAVLFAAYSVYLFLSLRIIT